MKTYYVNIVFMRSEEYKKKHRERERMRYWEKHKNDTAICKICGNEFLKIERK